MDDDLWRGAKLGLALAYARFGATDKACSEFDQAVANRGRPLPPGALANPPTLQAKGPEGGGPALLARSRLLNYYLVGVGRDPASIHGATMLVALNMADEGDLDGARHVLRMLAQSAGAALNDDESVFLLASVVSRQASLGDGAGAILTLAMLDRVAWLVSAEEKVVPNPLGDPREMLRLYRNLSRRGICT